MHIVCVCVCVCVRVHVRVRVCVHVCVLNYHMPCMVLTEQRGGTIIRFNRLYPRTRKTTHTRGYTNIAIDQYLCIHKQQHKQYCKHQNNKNEQYAYTTPAE